MKPILQARDARDVAVSPHRPAMNAFRHGLRSESLLIPGDDPREFESLRRDKVRMYRPCTREELGCVNRIAACAWRVDRHARFGTVFDAKLSAVLEDTTGTVAQHIDPDPHRWQHRGDDAARREDRFDRLLCRNERRLLELQRLRRHGLLAPGDELLKPNDPRPAEPEAAEVPETAAVPEPAATPAATEATGPMPQAAEDEPHAPVSSSPDTEIKKSDDRENGPAPVTAIKPRPPVAGPPGLRAMRVIRKLGRGGGR